MKKYLLSIIIILSFLFLSGCDNVKVPELIEGKEKVTVYLFRMQGCPHCEDELEFFETNLKKYGDYFEVVTYESSSNEINSSLLKKTIEKLGQEVPEKLSFPFTVIGDYSVGGYGGDMGNDLLNKIFSEYENKDHVDIVKSIASEMQDLKPTTVNEAMIEEGMKTEKETKASSPKETGIVIGIFSVVILGFGALIYFSMKKK